ncbi:trypsin-like peptidase domain-containing protein [Pseudodesulfovibrio indicus]|uniref:S1C family serine protease n=1 Tax=Pseudodesulfovibrio indicus TaxID=1716143 RepID=UPI00292E3DAB|nr:trypsin-like peptidase domain-containing protein [Pseudodesulfovibrio indicus]
MLNRILFLFILFLSLSVMAGCQTTSGGGTTGYSMFYSPGDHVAELLAQEKYQEADGVYGKEQEWFGANKQDPDTAAQLETLSRALEAEYGPDLRAATAAVQSIQWPAGTGQWAEAKTAMANLDQAVSKADAVNLFKSPQFGFAALDQAGQILKDKRAQIVQSAPTAFVAYPLGAESSFFDVYPVSLDGKAFLSAEKDAWTAKIGKADGPALLQAQGNYGGLLPDDMEQALAETYFKALCPDATKAGLGEIMTAYAKAGQAGMKLAAVPGVEIAFLEVTSDTLRKKGAIEFPVAVNLDLPFKAEAGDAKKGFGSATVRNADIVVVFNLAGTRTHRKVDTSNYVESSYIAGYRQVPNPEWDVMQVELQQANTEILVTSSSMESTDTDDPWKNLGNAIDNWGKESKVAEAKDNIEKIKEKIRTTPRYIDEPVYNPYQFQRVEMEVIKTGSVQYYIIDQRNKTYYTDYFDVSSKEFFTVAYLLQKSDPKLDEHMKTNVTEAYIDDFEKEPITVNLSDLLNHYSANSVKSKKFASLDVIRQDVIKNRNVAVAAVKKEEYGFDKRDDRRFESVVVVTAAGSLGTGFYVTDDVVLTNYHVVEEQKFIELKKYDKVETFGKVLAKDVRLDLALIKVQDRGQPVRFYKGKKVKIGDTVEAIGHPHGQEFTLTRGVISTVREHTAITRVQGKPVLFIQTDAPVNPGNSGGPLFLGDLVVGVNDWVVSKDIAEGLNFSIHYSEVFKFLEDNNIAYVKGE